MSRDRSDNNPPWPPLGNKANFITYTLLMRGDLSYNADKRGIVTSIRKRRGAPSNTVLPAISGTPTVGETLTTTNGTWTGTLPITYTYQWRRNGLPITGATASTYTLESADIGAQISCRVTATNVAGSGVADSNDLGPVQGASGTIYFGNRTLVGQGAAPIAAPDGTYGQFTVASGLITPNTSPLTVGTTQVNGVDVVVRNGNGDGARTVSNQTELDQVLALSSAPAWDTLEMRPGTYQFPVNFDTGSQGAGLRARSMVIRADVIPDRQNIANPNWSWVVIETAADPYSQHMIRFGGHAAPWEVHGIRFHRPESNYEDTGVWPGDLTPQASQSCVRFDSANSVVFRFYRCLFSSNIVPPTVDGGGFAMEMTGMWNRNANVEMIECGTHRVSVSFVASQSNATNSRTIVRDCLYVDTSNDGCVLSESSTTGYTYVEILNNHWQGFYSDGGVLHQDMNHRYKNRVYGIRRGNTFAPGPNFALNSVGAADDEVLAGRASYNPDGAFNFERGAIPSDGSNGGTGHHARNGVPNSTSDQTNPQTAPAVGTLPAAAGEAGSVYRIRCTNPGFPSTIQTSGGESIWSADGTTVIGTSLVAPSPGRGTGVWSDGVRWRLIPRRCWGRQWFVPCYSSTTLNPVLHNRANLRCFTQGGQIIIDIDGTTDAIWYSAVTWLEGSNGVVLRPAAGQTIEWRGQTYTNSNPMVFPRKGFCAGINRTTGSSIIHVSDAAIPMQALFANRNGPLQDGGNFISEHNIAIGVTASRGISCNRAGGGFEEWHRYNTVLQVPGLNDAGQIDGANPRVSSGWLAGSGTGVVGLDHTQGVRLSGNVCTGRFTTDTYSDPATHVGGVQMQPTAWLPASQLHTLMENYFGPPQNMLDALTREQVIAYATPRADTPEGQALIANWYGAVNGRYNWTTGQLTGATGPAPLRTLNPANGATAITVAVQPTIDCTQHITAGPGTVTIWNATTSTAVETFAASNTDRVQITANRIRIIPSNSLPGGANIQIRYTGDAFVGEHSAYLPEETGSGWQFATEQPSILVVDSRLPFDKGAMTWQANNTEPSARTPDYQTLGTAGGGWLSAAWLTNNGASASYTRADMRTSTASIRRWGTADTAFQPPLEDVPYAFVMDIARTGTSNQNLGILAAVPGGSTAFNTNGAGSINNTSFWGQTQRWFERMNNPATPSPTDPVWWRIIFLCIRATGENGLILTMLGHTSWNNQHFFRGGTLIPLDPQVAANRDAIFAASWPSV